MLQFGYKASAEQFGPGPLLEFAVAAERFGFDSVWTSDHFQPWRHTAGHAPNALVWLGAAAIATRRVTLGTSVLTPSFRYNPAIVGQAFATLGCLAPGRVILGVGTGESMNEVPVGVDWPEQSERFARLKEAIELISRLFREEFVTFEGNYFRTKNATIYDRPDRPVPIFVAASGPAAARLAGRLADGFICTSGKASDLGVDDPRVLERLSVDVEDVAHHRWLVSDDPSEHVEQIRGYIDYGFTNLVFHFPGNDQLRAMGLYAEHILPRLRAEFG